MSLIPGRVSIVIPSRNEAHLAKTVRGLLANAAGDVEILAMLEGPHAGEPVPDDPRVRVVLNPEPIGMRPCINRGAEMATGEFLMKVDAHVIMGEGYDAILKADCDVDWLVVPTRHSIDEPTWTVRPRDYNYSYTTWPYSKSMYGYGLHAKTWDWKENRRLNRERTDLVDDIMGFQGSIWLMHTEYFRRLGPLDHEAYYFYSESIETGMRVWATGGRCVINRKTFGAHLHKGRDNVGADGRPGRGFYLDVRKKRASEAYATDFWMNDRWPGTVFTFRQFIEKFWPLLQRVPEGERWPEDWDNPKYRINFLNRPLDEMPLHT